MNDIIKLIETQIKTLEEFMLNRAIDCNNGIKPDRADLLDLDMDKEPVSRFDYNDSINPSFDLGGWYQLNNILRECKKSIEKEQ